MYLKVESNSRGNIFINNLIIKKTVIETVYNISKQQLKLEDLNIVKKNNTLSLFININITKKNINIRQINYKIVQELNHIFLNIFQLKFKNIHTIFTNI